jgi:hypothetical protein
VKSRATEPTCYAWAPPGFLSGPGEGGQKMCLQTYVFDTSCLTLLYSGQKNFLNSNLFVNILYV